MNSFSLGVSLIVMVAIVWGARIGGVALMANADDVE